MAKSGKARASRVRERHPGNPPERPGISQSLRNTARKFTYGLWAIPVRRRFTPAAQDEIHRLWRGSSRFIV